MIYEVNIVSGFPRSGTSLMMRILKESGYSIFEDEFRKPDMDNPYGYFEHSLVYSPPFNPLGWIYSLGESVVKVPLPTLPRLPDDISYRVIIMKRNFKEVSESFRLRLQHVTRGEQRNLSPGRSAENLEKDFNQIVEVLAERPNFKLLIIPFLDCIEKNSSVLGQLNNFFGPLTVTEGILNRVVDPSLYRIRL